MRKMEPCVYCGETSLLTLDHVPPRCLFSKPRPSLITVPCCRNCNGQLGKHDEYFRIAITTGIDSRRFPKESADSVRAIRNLARPRSRGFALSLLAKYHRGSSSLSFEAQRIEIVLWRLTRGLFFHHRKLRMSGPIAFSFKLMDEKLKLSPTGRARVSRLASKLITIGPGVFRYNFEPFLEPDPFGMAWLMRFYDHKTFFCVTASDTPENQEKCQEDEQDA